MAPFLIQGGVHDDSRGKIAFVNDFDMAKVQRFYAISPRDTAIVRAWQGHKIESKWFYVVKGSFLVRLIKIDNWESPSLHLSPTEFILEASNSQVLYIPGGYANGFKALEADSTLMVFSDCGLYQTAQDDYRFPADYWFEWAKLEV